jgi:hypothetical protein
MRVVGPFAGTVDNGHYYSFIKDRKSKNWFRFNDSQVTPIDAAKIPEECFGGFRVQRVRPLPMTSRVHPLRVYSCDFDHRATISLSFGPIGQKFTASVTKACARRPGAAASVSRRRCERRILLACGGRRASRSHTLAASQLPIARTECMHSNALFVASVLIRRSRRPRSMVAPARCVFVLAVMLETISSTAV